MLLTPCELTLAILGLVEPELRPRGSIYPSDARVVPYHGPYARPAGVGQGILDGLAAVHLVPLGID